MASLRVEVLCVVWCRVGTCTGLAQLSFVPLQYAAALVIDRAYVKDPLIALGREKRYSICVLCLYLLVVLPGQVWCQVINTTLLCVASEVLCMLACRRHSVQGSLKCYSFQNIIE